MDEDLLEDIEFDDTLVPWEDDWMTAVDQPWYTDVWDWFKDNSGSLLSIGSGLYGMYQGREMQQMAQQAFGRSDPFGPYRGQYAEQLSKLMADPSSIKNDPGYKQAFDQGQLAVERSLAAKGFIGSGNAAIELQEYGQTFGMDYLNNRIAQLAGLAGANIAPNFGPAMSGYGAGADLQSQGLASIGYGVGGMVGGGASAGTPAAARAGFNPAGGEAAEVAEWRRNLGLARSATKLAGSAAGALGWDAGKGALGSLGRGLGAAGSALGVYSGLKQGGFEGYLTAARSGLQLAQLAGLGGTTAATGASSAASAGSAGAGGLGVAGQALGVLGALYGVKNTIDIMQTGDVKNSAISGASTGAAIGSIVPGLGTLLGAGIGALVGSVGALITGKDNPEEKVADSYYGNREKNKIQLGIVDDKSFTTALVGEFRRSRSSFPARLAGYGPKDDDKWAADLATRINKAYQAGTITKADDAFTIYDKVVDPWFQSQGGWGKWLAQKDIANMQTITLDTIHRYISGRPITWQEAHGQRPEHAFDRYLGLDPAPTQQSPLKSGHIQWGRDGKGQSVLEAMRDPGKWMTIQPVQGRPF